jgi:hypothetical protein
MFGNTHFSDNSAFLANLTTEALFKCQNASYSGKSTGYLTVEGFTITFAGDDGKSTGGKADLIIGYG